MLRSPYYGKKTLLFGVSRTDSRHGEVGSFDHVGGDGDDQDPTAVFEFLDVHQAEFSIVARCRLLRVSRSSYYAWRERLPSQRSAADQALMTQIKAIYTASRGVYGTPRIPATLRAQGVRTSRRKGKPKRAGQGRSGTGSSP